MEYPDNCNDRSAAEWLHDHYHFEADAAAELVRRNRLPLNHAIAKAAKELKLDPTDIEGEVISKIERDIIKIWLFAKGPLIRGHLSPSTAKRFSADGDLSRKTFSDINSERSIGSIETFYQHDPKNYDPAQTEYLSFGTKRMEPGGHVSFDEVPLFDHYEIKDAVDRLSLAPAHKDTQTPKKKRGGRKPDFPWQEVREDTLAIIAIHHPEISRQAAVEKLLEKVFIHLGYNEDEGEYRTPGDTQLGIHAGKIWQALKRAEDHQTADIKKAVAK